MKKTFRRHAPSPMISAARVTIRRYRNFRELCKNKLIVAGDWVGVVDPDSIYSDEFFKKRRFDPWRAEANQVGNIFMREFNPSSVIDFGCAIGSYLEPFFENDIKVTGIEGAEKAKKHAVIPTEHIVIHDLRRQYESQKKYDLAMSIEVAEHLPERYADTFVDTLVFSSDLIILTAARPGQPGKHHVNLQPREYWKRKFCQRGYEYDGQEVEKLRSLIDVNKTEWIPDNLFVFVKNNI